MTSVEKAKMTLEWTLEQIEQEQDEEVLERLIWFYRDIYKLYWAWQTPLLMSLN